MKKIVLMCSAGASTSMLMRKMREAAAEEGYDCTIEAHPTSEAADYADSDAILLGPQVKFQLDEVRSKVNCPVEVIDMMLYGTMNGKAVLEFARKMMEA